MSELSLQEQESIVRAKRVKANAIPLSNIIELATSVVFKLSGHMSDSIDRKPVNRAVLGNLIANTLKEKYLPSFKVGEQNAQ